MCALDRRQPLRVKDVCESLLAQADLPNPTVDGLLCGDERMEVRGIAVAFMPSLDVLLRARERGANLVIAHEGLYYSHWHERTGHLSGDPVSRNKRAAIEETGLAVIRLHDACHRLPGNRDGIMEGLLHQLHWDGHVIKETAAYSLVELPDRPGIDRVAADIKRRLRVPMLRYVGHPELCCRRIGLLVGYRGGAEPAVPLFHREQADLVIYGEGPEWETPEYVRDAAAQGRKIGLIVLGHAESEDPGMALLAARLAQRYDPLPVFHLPHAPLFQWK